MSDIEAITDAITKIGTSEFPVNIDLWDAEKVAAYLKISKSRLSNYYAIQPGFPAPGRLPSQKGVGRPLWRAIDVIQWVNENVFEPQKTTRPRRLNRATRS
jgi:hypothetical protein